MSAPGTSDAGPAGVAPPPVALGRLWLAAVGAALLVVGHAAWVLLSRILAQPASAALTSLSVALLWAGALVLVLRVSAHRGPRAHTWTAVAIIAVATVARAAWVATFDAHQISDFGVYLRCGQWLASGPPGDLGAWLETCRSGYSLDLVTYWERALLYTAPLGLLGPLDTSSIETANVLLLTVASGLFFLFARAVLGARLGLVALLLFVSHPELWYAATLASHDVPAVFWLVVALHAQLVAADPRRQLKARVAASVALGLAVAALGVQRKWDLPLLIAMGAVGASLVWRLVAARLRREATPARALGVLLLLLVALPGAVYGALRQAEAVALAPHDLGQRASLLATVAETDVRSDNTWAATFPWVRYFQPQLPPDERSGLLRRKAIAEFFSEPSQTLAHWRTKNEVLAVPDGYFFFTSVEEPRSNLDTFPTRVGRVNGGPRPLQRAAILGWAVLVTLLTGLRLLLAPRRPVPPRLAFAVLFAAALYAYLLLLAQVQARYSLFLLAVVPLLSAEALALLARDPESAESAGRSGWREGLGTVLLGAALSLGLVVGALAAGRALLRDAQWGLRDLAHFTVEPPSAAAQNDSRVLVLRLPPDAAGGARAQRQFACRSCRRVGVFLSDEVYPLLSAPPPGSEDERLTPAFVLRADGVTLAHGPLRGVRYVAAPLPEGTGAKGVLTLELEVEAPARAPYERLVSLRYLLLE